MPPCSFYPPYFSRQFHLSVLTTDWMRVQWHVTSMLGLSGISKTLRLVVPTVPWLQRCCPAGSPHPPWSRHHSALPTYPWLKYSPCNYASKLVYHMDALPERFLHDCSATLDMGVRRCNIAVPPCMARTGLGC